MQLYNIHYFYMNFSLIHIIQLFIKVKHLQNQLFRVSYKLNRQDHQNFTEKVNSLSYGNVLYHKKKKKKAIEDSKKYINFMY